jgi:hypothetical protein
MRAVEKISWLLVLVVLTGALLATTVSVRAGSGARTPCRGYPGDAHPCQCEDCLRIKTNFEKWQQSLSAGDQQRLSKDRQDATR